VFTEGQRKTQAAGISTVRDRSLRQRDAVDEPISKPTSTEIYGYARGATPAGRERWRSCCIPWSAGRRGRRPRGLLGSIQHSDLLKAVGERVVDRSVLLHMIQLWLDCTVEETDKTGRKNTHTEASDTRRGIQQGAHHPQPLLAIHLMPGLCGGGRSSDLSEVSATALSPMPMT